MSSLLRRLVVPPLVAASVVLAIAGTALAGTPDVTVSVYNEDGTPADGSVCDFFFEFNELAGGETGAWSLRDSSFAVVAHGAYAVTDTAGDRKPATGAFSLADGTYRLLWDDETPIDSSHRELQIVVSCGSNQTAAPTGTPQQSLAGQTSVASEIPSQNVGGFTSRPQVTLPSTTTDAPGTANTIPWAGLLLPAVAAVLALIVLGTPRRGARRR
jgi:hypothetical protein